jgi:hypothetical protein
MAEHAEDFRSENRDFVDIDDEVTELYDVRCPRCSEPVRQRQCTALDCEDGYFDGYEDDPLWYDPGDLVRYSECGGKGVVRWWSEQKLRTVRCMNNEIQSCELNVNSWAVVNWRGVCSTRLTYDAAVNLVQALNASPDPSLVIVTAEVAARIEERKT